MAGLAEHTSGGLYPEDLAYNEKGKLVSIKASRAASKTDNLAEHNDAAGAGEVGGGLKRDLRRAQQNVILQATQREARRQASYGRPPTAVEGGGFIKDAIMKIKAFGHMTPADRREMAERAALAAIDHLEAYVAAHAGANTTAPSPGGSGMVGGAEVGGGFKRKERKAQQQVILQQTLREARRQASFGQAPTALEPGSQGGSFNRLAMMNILHGALHTRK